MFRYTFLRGVVLLFFLLFSAIVFADTHTTILTTAVLESFEEDPNKGWGEATTRWIARGSKFISREYDENSGEVVGTYPKTASAEAYPTALFGIKSEKNEFGQPRKAFGIMGKFDRKGYNYLEIIPARLADENTKEEDIIYEDINTGAKWVHAPVKIPGRVQNFDLWVWGSNYDYYLDAHFQDYRGMVHSFRMGDLKYAGWRLLRTAIPGSIPQAEPYIPRFKPLVLTKFVLWTRPHERVDGFYIYLDELKVLTDVYEGRFDGDDLADIETTQDIWASGSR